MSSKQLASPSFAARSKKRSEDLVKAGGVHYTPPELATFMAIEAWRELGSRRSVRVIDPACGNGDLLLALAATAPRTVKLSVVGFDTDPQAVTSATERLSALTDVDIRQGDFLDTLQLCDPSVLPFHGDSISNDLVGAFDLVIANPPYVRTQVLGAKRAQRLAKQFGLSGRTDLYHAFIMGMSLVLRESGVLSLLCSNRFMTTRSGQDLRGHLNTTYQLRKLFDLGDSRLFSAAVLPAVVVARKESSQTETNECSFSSVYEVRKADDPSTIHDEKFDSVISALNSMQSVTALVGETRFRISHDSIRITNDNRRPWIGVTTDRLQEIDQRAHLRFGDIGKIRVGIKTTADSVFIRDDWDGLDDSVLPEQELLLPLITHHGARRWQAADPTKWVLYPYDLSESKRRPLPLAQWPRAAAYLDSHRTRLESRKYVVSGGREWWEIWVPQRPAGWAGWKITFPDISELPKFSLDRSGAVVNGDCYWISVDQKDKDLAYLMLAVANSSLATYYYDNSCGNKLYSGRRRWITQYVERFPLPDPNCPEAGKLAALVSRLCAKRIREDEVPGLEEEADNLVWRSFGFEEAPR